MKTFTSLLLGVCLATSSMGCCCGLFNHGCGRARSTYFAPTPSPCNSCAPAPSACGPGGCGPGAGAAYPGGMDAPVFPQTGALPGTPYNQTAWLPATGIHAPQTANLPLNPLPTYE